MTVKRFWNWITLITFKLLFNMALYLIEISALLHCLRRVLWQTFHRQRTTSFILWAGSVSSRAGIKYLPSKKPQLPQQKFPCSPLPNVSLEGCNPPQNIQQRPNYLSIKLVVPGDRWQLCVLSKLLIHRPWVRQ